MTVFQIYVISAIAIATLVGVYLVSVAVAKAKQGKSPAQPKRQPSATKNTPPGSAWWVEVVTAEPPCTYYFGPFESSSEAEEAKPGYVEDLGAEGALEIIAQVKWCAPKELTQSEDYKQPVSAS